MTELDQAVEQTFKMQCKGRDAEGNEVFGNPVEVKVMVRQEGSKTIKGGVEGCEYTTGLHRHLCNASHSRGEEVGCPYVFQIPHTLDYAKKAIKEAESRDPK
ncbi:MAG: hypothetical protein V3V78_03820 [Candidatus Woesearchaeota archaeon]